jgi:hypothetical protein
MLVEVGDGEVRCVASDRYRLAVGWAPVVGSSAVGPAVAGERLVAVVPVDWADRVAAACRAGAADTEVELDVDAEQVGASVGRDLFATAVVPGSFPDYRAVVGGGPDRGAADAEGLRSQLPIGTESVGLVVLDGRVQLAPPHDAAAADVLVDPTFLHEALAVAGTRPTLVLDGPHRPLAIRGDGAGFSVLMPVAPDGLRP